MDGTRQEGESAAPNLPLGLAGTMNRTGLEASVRQAYASLERLERELGALRRRLGSSVGQPDVP